MTQQTDPEDYELHDEYDLSTMTVAPKGRYASHRGMDTLEVITAETTADDELDFWRFVSRNRNVRIISLHATANGLVDLSFRDIVRRRASPNVSDQTFLLWNTGIPRPLCWGLYLRHYDTNWEPVEPAAGKVMPYPRTTEAWLACHTSFRCQTVDQRLFRNGYVYRLLSPVIEVNIPSDKRGGFFDLRAELSNWLFGVWLTWDAHDEKWQHETRDLEQLLEREYEQPPEFVEWQEEMFDWVREKWPGSIVPDYTYRLGPQNPKESIGRLAQSLANLMGKNIVGFEPHPPSPSRRSGEQAL